MNSSLSQIGLLLLRVGFSGMLLTHGIPKLLKIIAGDFSFGDPLGIGPTTSLILACIAEVLFSILVILGFKTRLSTIPIIITMAVAAFIAERTGRAEDDEAAAHRRNHLELRKCRSFI